MTGTLLTLGQVAAMLQISERTVRRAIDTGGLRAVQVGTRRAWRVRPDDLDAWVEQRATPPVAGDPGRVAAVAPITPAGACRPAPRRRGSTGGHLTVAPGMGRDTSKQEGNAA